MKSRLKVNFILPTNPSGYPVCEKADVCCRPQVELTLYIEREH